MTSRVKTIEIIIQFQYGTGKKLGYLKYYPVSLPTLIGLCVTGGGGRNHVFTAS